MVAPARLEAATWFWGPEAPIFIPPPPRYIDPPIVHRRPKASRRPLDPARIVKTKPDGPLIIAISLQHQHMKVYDSNGLFAESPVSTGMPGHATPMGVFSVLEKQRWHRSNIYSGAPMPYMQRITWSGIAIHEGVLPGYPASHGCIRMPQAFAIKLWAWTKRGARVVIAPGDIEPENFSHAKLLARMIDGSSQASAVPLPTAAGASAQPDKTDVKLATRSDVRNDTQPVKSDIATETATATNAPAATVGQDKTTSQNQRPTDAASARPVVADGAPAPASAASDGAANKTQTADAARQPDPSLRDAPAATGGADPAAIAPKRTGHVAVFISRKDSKLYVRQNFSPVFEAPVTIADPDKPLGTFVFTARGDKDDASALHWSVVSMPVVTRKTSERTGRHGKREKPIVETVLSAPSATAASDALDRITIPEDALQRIAEAIKPGGSLVISDRGLGGETGLGTDFIVPLR
jgi:lipoprotein-anchoring transpeptidase ErfK/SrfK